ncbi:MAG TPA: methyl-accepting chemotaxis protein [Terriglobales bacterium]|nr:methyl-accepting chemotaxis protein [Terriglobales bacterium]
MRTIRAKLMFAMGALAVAAAGLALYGIHEVNAINDKMNLVIDVIGYRIVYVSHANEALLNYYRYQKNHILETDPAAKDKWEEEQAKAEVELNAALGEWEKIASEGGKEKLRVIRTSFADFKRANDRILALSNADQQAKAREISNGEAHRAYEAADVALSDASAMAEGQMKTQGAESDAMYDRTRLWMTLITVLAISLCCGVSYLVVASVVQGLALVVERMKDVAQGEGDLTKRIEVRNDDELGELSRWFNTFMDKLQQIVRQVAQSTEYIASAAEELSSTATQTSHSAAAQRDQAAQVAAAVQEMSSTVLQVGENATKASQNARRAGESARSGGTIVDETVDVIQSLAASTRDTAVKIQELGRSSDQIGQIIGVIDDIADQTNLLALNAAIEAARAGEQGRGFAVVADEVRKLAERTTHATKEIAQMIKTIQQETQCAVEAMQSGTSAVERGVESATKAGVSLNEIIQASELVNDMITQIATAATQQSAATQQVTANMDQIAGLILESSVGAEQSAKACSDLSDLAMDLQQLVARFNLGEEIRRHPGKTQAAPARPLQPEIPVVPVRSERRGMTVQ